MATKTLVDTDSAQTITNKTAIAIGTDDYANRPLHIEGGLNGVPQVRISHELDPNNRFGEIRVGGDGTDDGDLYFTQSGDNVWMQSSTTGHRLTNSLVPRGSIATAPANIELHGLNYLIDSTNFERLRIYSKGSSDNANTIASEAGGTGTVRSIQVTAGSNHLWLDAPTGAVCIGTTDSTGASTGDLVLNGYLRIRGGIVATASLPAGSTAMNGTILIEDTGAGCNLVVYKGGQRFRFTGSAAF